MQERGLTSNSELVLLTPDFIKEALQYDTPVDSGVEIPNIEEYKDYIEEVFSLENKPSSDTDRGAWVLLLYASYLGYRAQQAIETGSVITEDDFITHVQEQLKNDEARWGDTWKKRTIEGQLERTYFDFNNYKDKDKNGNEPLPWLKVAGNVIICLTRLDNPDYQK